MISSLIQRANAALFQAYASSVLSRPAAKAPRPTRTLSPYGSALFMAITLALFVTLTPEGVLAQQSSAISETLGNFVGEIIGPGGIGRPLATIAVIIIGIAALMGKVSWGMALIVAVGIGVVFGAGTIVNFLSNGVDTGQITAR